MDLSTIGGIALLGLAAYSQRAKLGSLASGGLSWVTGASAATASPGRPEAIAALDSVIAHFEANGCPEGAAAARLVGPHFWHTKDEHAKGGAL